jgi:hypothetical protein
LRNFGIKVGVVGTVKFEAPVKLRGLSGVKDEVLLTALPLGSPDRHIESSKIGHTALLLLMLEAAYADPVSPSA